MRLKRQNHVIEGRKTKRNVAGQSQRAKTSGRGVERSTGPFSEMMKYKCTCVSAATHFGSTFCPIKIKVHK